MSKKIMEKDGQTAHVDVESGSVELMEEQGWKVTGDAPPDPEPVVVGIKGLGIPAFLLTQRVLEEGVLMDLGELPSAFEADSLCANLEGLFGDKFTESHAKYVRSKIKAEEQGSDPDYAGMTKAQIKELLDAKGVAYEERDNKDKLVERLKDSAK